MIYFTSDLHFNHKNVIKYCNRPFASVAKMDNALINNWNQVVSKEDEVFVLGDLTLDTNKEKIKAWVERLNGTKHLILGNHDQLKVWNYIDCGFASIHTSLKIDNLYLAHDPAVKTALPEDAILLHGHVHQLWKMIPEKKLINVGVDVWDYKPVSLIEIKELLK